MTNDLGVRVRQFFKQNARKKYRPAHRPFRPRPTHIYSELNIFIRNTLSCRMIAVRVRHRPRALSHLLTAIPFCNVNSGGGLICPPSNFVDRSARDTNPVSNCNCKVCWIVDRLVLLPVRYDDDFKLLHTELWTQCRLQSSGSRW